MEVSTPLSGADGIVFTDDHTLVVVNNNPGKVYELQSDDQFATARITATFETGNVFPTTAAARDGEAYVLYAQLNTQAHPVSQFPIERAAFAELP